MGLNNTDDFVVNRSGANYKVSYQELKKELNIVDGTINKPSVLQPDDGAGGNTGKVYPRTDTIDAVDNGVTTELTLDSVSDLDDMSGSVFMTNGTRSSAEGPYNGPTPYTLKTTEISAITDQTGYIKWLSDGSSEGWATSTSDASVIGPTGVCEAGYLYTTIGRSTDKLVFYFNSIGVTISQDTEVQFNCGLSGGNGWTTTSTTVYTDAGNATMSGGTDDPSTQTRVDNIVTIPAGATYMALDPMTNGTASQQNFGGVIIGGITYDLWVNSASPGKVLTFSGDLTTNPDLQYFLPNDVLQNDANTYVINTGALDGSNTNTMTVSGGDWSTSNSANNSQVWTSLISGDYYTLDGTAPPRNGFDGDPNTYTLTNYVANGVATFSASGFTPGATVEVKTLEANPGGSGGGNGITTDAYITINGQNYIANNNAAGSADFIRTGTVDDQGNLTIVYTSATAGGAVGWNYVGIYSVTVDGKVLVDKIYDDKVWSDELTAGSSPQSPYPATLAFNGNVISAYNCCFPDKNSFVEVDFDGAFNNASVVTLYYVFANINGFNAYIEINGNQVSVPGTSGTSASVATFDVSGAGLQKLKWTEVDSSNYIGIFGISVDGVPVIDKGVYPDFGESEVTYPTLGGMGQVASFNVGNNTLTLTPTGTRDNRWIGDNLGGIPFYVAGPEINDDPLVIADITLVSTPFQTTPPNAGPFTNAEWTITNQETDAVQVLNAGPTTSYKPPDGTFDIDTEYVVSVIYQSASLQDSEPSADSSFTTGPATNLYSLVSSLSSRLGSIESDEISDDAVDNALITLVGSMSTQMTAWTTRIEQLEAYENQDNALLALLSGLSSQIAALSDRVDELEN